MSAFRGHSDVTINYNSVGSGGGVEQFIAGATEFAGSDAALDPSAGEVDKAKERCGADVLEVPDYISPIAMDYNLAGRRQPAARRPRRWPTSSPARSPSGTTRRSRPHNSGA